MKPTASIRRRTTKNQRFIKQWVALANKIWQERPHTCQITGEALPGYFNIQCFAHVLSRGAYPNESMSLNPRNIVLMKPEMHYKYDNQGVADDPRFDWLIELKQQLKEEYYKNLQTR